VRKFLQVIGAISLIFYCLVGIGVGIIFYKTHGFDKESKAYIDSAIPAIAANWNQGQLLSRVTPDFRKVTSADQLAGILDTLSTLGSLVQYEGAKGGSTFSYTITNGEQISALYVAKAKFQNGSATFRVFLVRLNGQWMIEGFHADPVLASGP
jgi:hypothetical protein